MKNRERKISKKTTAKVDRQIAERQLQATQCICNWSLKGKKREQKIFEEIMAKIYIFDKNYTPTDPRCSMSPKQ